MGKLPDFLIIGEMKCGTTALYKYVTKHPQVDAAERKEINFFNTHYDEGIKWYKRQFPDYTVHLTGEASGYLRVPDIATKVYRLLPQAKMIVILRNPVDRAYSHYQMHLQKGKISIPFEKAIQRIPDYLNQGKYAWKLRNWMEVFPIEQFHIILSEKLNEFPQEIMDGLFEYLDLSSYSLDFNKKHNVQSYTDIHPKTRKKLIDYYKPYNEELYQLLDMTFDWDR